jgi:hypothetical protein
MAQWGRNNHGVTANASTTAESSNGAPMGVYALVKGSGKSNNPISMDSNAHFGNTSPGSRASVDVNLYGNTTVGAFIQNQAVGVFAVNSSQMNVTGGALDIGIVTSGGSGYQANATVTLTVVNGGSSGVANATSGTSGTSAGRITALNIQTAGSGYITAPTVAIAAPAAINITANTVGVVNNALLITSANSYWQVGDALTYSVPAGNTAIPGLTSGTTYYVALSNTTGVQLAATSGGTVITLTPATTTPGQTHTVQGTTATGYVDVATVYPTVTHSGWVKRVEGTGGRAGRVFYETLVAMGSLGQNTVSSTGVVGNIDTVVANTQNDPFV